MPNIMIEKASSGPNNSTSSADKSKGGSVSADGMTDMVNKPPVESDDPINVEL